MKLAGAQAPRATLLHRFSSRPMTRRSDGAGATMGPHPPNDQWVTTEERLRLGDPPGDGGLARKLSYERLLGVQRCHGRRHAPRVLLSELRNGVHPRGGGLVIRITAEVGTKWEDSREITRLLAIGWSPRFERHEDRVEASLTNPDHQPAPRPRRRGHRIRINRHLASLNEAGGSPGELRSRESSRQSFRSRSCSHIAMLYPAPVSVGWLLLHPVAIQRGLPGASGLQG